MAKYRLAKVDLLHEYISFGVDLLGFWKRFTFFFKDHSLYTVIKKNKELIKHENGKKKIYICGLGPSLQNVNFNKIDGDTFCVNGFFKFNHKFTSFIPTYYMMLDDKYATVPKIIAEAKNALDAYINKGTIYFLNSKNNHSDLLKSYPKDKIYYFSTFRGDFHPNKNYDIAKIMPVSGNVITFSILLSMLMGYKEIYLLGCDFNSFTTKKELHCYDDSNNTKDLTLSQDLLAYAQVAKYHERLHQFALRKGIKIYNATKGSLIDAYPFVELTWA